MFKLAGPVIAFGVFRLLLLQLSNYFLEHWVWFKCCGVNKPGYLRISHI